MRIIQRSKHLEGHTNLMSNLLEQLEKESHVLARNQVVKKSIVNALKQVRFVIKIVIVLVARILI
jgi:hypothetical protein